MKTVKKEVSGLLDSISEVERRANKKIIKTVVKIRKLLLHLK